MRRRVWVAAGSQVRVTTALLRGSSCLSNPSPPCPARSGRIGWAGRVAPPEHYHEHARDDCGYERKCHGNLLRPFRRGYEAGGIPTLCVHCIGHEIDADRPTQGPRDEPDGYRNRKNSMAVHSSDCRNGAYRVASGSHGSVATALLRGSSPLQNPSPPRRCHLHTRPVSAGRRSASLEGAALALERIPRCSQQKPRSSRRTRNAAREALPRHGVATGGAVVRRRRASGSANDHGVSVRSLSLAVRSTCRGSTRGSRPPDAGGSRLKPRGSAGSPRGRCPPPWSSSDRVSCCPCRRSGSEVWRRTVCRYRRPSEPDVPARASDSGTRAETRRQTQPRLSCLASRGIRPCRSAFRTPAICATAPSFRSRVPTGSRGTRTPTRAPTCPGGSTVTNTRSGRSSRCSLSTERTHPNAPRVVVGDISLRDGGVMDQHVSHRERTRRRRLLPATRRMAAGADFHGTDRPTSLAGPARRLRRSRSEQDLRRLRDRPARTA